MCTGISRQITTASSGVKVNIRKVDMLRIKVFQNGLTRIYMTNSFKLGSRKNEFYNFLEAATNVNLGHKKLIGFEDAETNTKVFVSPIACLIEIEEVADE